MEKIEIPDLNTPLEDFEKLCEENPKNSDLQHELALRYMDITEDGNMVNMERAIYWFKKAADNGDEMAARQYMLLTNAKKFMEDELLPDFATENDYYLLAIMYDEKGGF